MTLLPARALPVRAVAIVAVAALIGACSDDGSPVVEPSVTSGGSPSSTAPGGGAGLTGGSTTPVSVAGSEFGHITGVRTAAQDGFDRIVFEFERAVPGYQVRYVGRPVVADPSDEEVDIGGEAVLEVRLEPSSIADLSGSELRMTYTGPDRVSGDTTNVVEVVKVGDFEAVATWVIGVRTEARFKVSTLSAPHRLIIDVAG